MDLESQNSIDARVEQLWRKLDVESKGELDLKGLKRGFKRIKHPLQDADPMLQDVLKALDKNGDGKIQYEEFRVFVEQAERRLRKLFDELDRDHNGKLDKSELQAAIESTGIAVPKRDIESFFRQVDTNHDGVISFDEWRNFLLFLPTERPGLKAIIQSYSSAAVTINSEGDTLLSDDAVEGLGKKFLNLCFGSIINIAMSTRPLHPENRNITQTRPETANAREITSAMSSSVFGNSTEERNRPMGPGTTAPTSIGSSSFSKPPGSTGTAPASAEASESVVIATAVIPSKDNLLTRNESLGYFVAGAVAGAVSRTSTAPLDRLKTYLIASTAKPELAITAAAKGDIAAVVKHLGRPLVDAVKELWKAGGLKSLYSGNGLNIAKVMPESAIRFGAYEAAKKAVARFEGHNDPKNISVFSKFVAGGLAGVVAQACVYPIDTLKFRMQCDTVSNGLRGNALIIHTAQSMIKTGGLATAYRGLTVGLLGMFPYAAIDFGIMEILKTYYITRQARKLGLSQPLSTEDLQKAQPGPIGYALIGACSGSTGATIVYPVNLLRTRLQAQGTVLHPAVYGGFKDVFVKTVEREGYRGLWKGLTPNLLKVAPAVSISYMTYESTKKCIGL